jgi:hypothetical protein
MYSLTLSRAMLPAVWNWYDQLVHVDFLGLLVLGQVKKQ